MTGDQRSVTSSHAPHHHATTNYPLPITKLAFQNLTLSKKVKIIF
ncbi:hypothetical protein [Chroococcidiopsis sp.]